MHFSQLSMLLFCQSKVILQIIRECLFHYYIKQICPVAVFGLTTVGKLSFSDISKRKDDAIFDRYFSNKKMSKRTVLKLA